MYIKRIKLKIKRLQQQLIQLVEASKVEIQLNKVLLGYKMKIVI